MATEYDSISLRISAASADANKAVNNLQKTLGKLSAAVQDGDKKSGSFSKSLGQLAIKAASVGLVVHRLAKKAGELYNAFGDYVEAINLFRVTMGEAADAEMAFAQKANALLGIDIKEWAESQGAFQQLAIGFGVASDKAVIMSRNLTQLSYDLSSLFNVDVETAMQKLQSGMGGQVKGLRAYGIETSVAALQEYALSKGIEQSVSSMNMAQRTLLRYNLIMERTANIQGDLARTMESPANALRMLKSLWNSAKIEIGAIVAVIATKVIPIFQAFVIIIRDAAASLAALFDVKIEDYYADLSGLGSIGTGAEDAEDSLAGAADSAKKIRSYMLGFDELNVISPNDSSGSGSGSSGGGWESDLGLYEYEWLKEAESNMDALVQKLKDALPYVDGIGAGFATWLIVKKMKLPLDTVFGLIMTISGAVMFVTSAIDAWTNGVDWNNLQQMLLGATIAVAGLFALFGSTGAVIGGVAAGIAMLVIGIKDWISKGEMTEETCVLMCAGLGLIGIALSTVTGGISLLVAAIGIVALVVVKNWDKIKAWFNEKIKPVFTKEFWTNMFDGIKKGFEQTWKNAINGAIELFNKFIEWVNEKLNFSWQPIKIAGKTIIDGGSFQLFTIPTIPKFSNGGFPEDGMFFANSGELVGKFSNGRTAVANNEQITEGIASAVYRAVSDAMSETSGGNFDLNVFISGKQVESEVEKVKKERGATVMSGGVAYSY